MVGITQPVWEKSACFSRLSTALRRQLGSHSVSDLITAASSHLPIETTAAFEEATCIQDKVKNAVTRLDFLEPLGFLDASGAPISVTSSDLEDRPAGVSFVRLNSCIHGKLIDDRIVQDKLEVTICLKLPQSSRNASSGIITPISAQGTLVVKVEYAPEKKRSTLFGSMTSGGTPTEIVEVSNTRKNRLFAAKNDTSDTTISWFGDPDFLDDNHVFVKEFGTLCPQIFPSQPNLSFEDKQDGAMQAIQVYAEKCMFDVFLELCRTDYVGSDDAVDNSLAIQEVCSNITALKQKFKNQFGKSDIMSPDELYNMFLRFAPSLPDDPSGWTIQLSSAFFNALVDELKAKMLASGFKLPQTLPSSKKADELDALRSVRMAASTQFKKLADEVSLMDKVLGSRGGMKTNPQQSIMGKTLFYCGDGDDFQPATPPTTHTGQLFYQSQSPAEQTLQRYKGPPKGTHSPGAYNPDNLPTRIGPTGLPHPYRADAPDVLSRFPLGFRGCFLCGGEDHNNTRYCPKKESIDKKEFFKELWIHKPRTKRPSMYASPSGTPTRNVSLPFVHNHVMHATIGISLIVDNNEIPALGPAYLKSPRWVLHI